MGRPKIRTEMVELQVPVEMSVARARRILAYAERYRLAYEAYVAASTKHRPSATRLHKAFCVAQARLEFAAGCK